MADYWKSNPRKFCEVCKCWLADNKPSIEFHEGGRRHQANVRKQLQTARTRSAENEKEKLDIAKTLHAIEHAAISAYQQDLAGGPAKGAKLPQTAELEQVHQVQDFLTQEQQKIERELEKKSIEFKAQQKIQEIQTQALQKAYQSYTTSYLSPWQQAYSPEGYVYYYNTATGASQWEAPEHFQPATQPPPLPPATSQALTPSAVPPVSAAPPPPDSPTTNDRPAGKRAASEAGVEAEERDLRQPAAKRRDPYGGWTTVSVIEREVREEEDVQEEGVGEGEGADEEEDDAREDEIQFEEKKLSEGQIDIGADELKGEFKAFSFKKRTSKGRPQIRNRIGDV